MLVNVKAEYHTFGCRLSPLLCGLTDFLEDDDDGFGRLNFEPSNYLNKQGKNQPFYYLTKDGFMDLALSFTGKKAMKLRRAYITQFNRMELFIRENHLPDVEAPIDWVQARLEGKQERRNLTDIIRDHLIPVAIEAGSQHSHMLYVN